MLNAEHGILAIDPEHYRAWAEFASEQARNGALMDRALSQPLTALAPGRKSVTIRAVPYCTWGNRKPGEMLVWIRQE